MFATSQVTSSSPAPRLAVFSATMLLSRVTLAARTVTKSSSRLYMAPPASAVLYASVE
jgi:hypothetical protein